MSEERDEPDGRGHDPRVLRAIAHPVRSRILGELDASGPLRAADIAADLAVPANQASFHLRQLAKYGLVEEAPELARDRRDRVWRIAGEPGTRLNLTDAEQVPGGAAAVGVFRRRRLAWGRAVVERAYASGGEEGTLRRVSEVAVRLTKQEAGELADELDAVLEAWVERTRGRDDGRRTYLHFSALQPYPDVAPGDD